MLTSSRKPDPLMALGVIAALILLVAVACVSVKGGGCEEVGMSPVAAPATARPRPPAAPRLEKVPAPARPRVTKAPPAARTPAPAGTTRRYGTGGHGGGHVDVDVDLCD